MSTPFDKSSPTDDDLKRCDEVITPNENFEVPSTGGTSTGGSSMNHHINTSIRRYDNAPDVAQLSASLSTMHNQVRDMRNTANGFRRDQLVTLSITLERLESAQLNMQSRDDYAEQIFNAQQRLVQANAEERNEVNVAIETIKLAMDEIRAGI